MGSDAVVIDGAALIVSEYVRVAVAPAASVIVTVTDEVPVAVGVPEMTPVLALMFKPAWSPVADHAYGFVPPVAVTATPGYERLTVETGNDTGPVIDVGPLIVSE